MLGLIGWLKVCLEIDMHALCSQCIVDGQCSSNKTLLYVV